MSFLNRLRVSQAPPRLAGPLLFAFLALACLPAAPASAAGQALTPDQVGAVIEADARAGPLYAAVKTHYPRDYRAFLQRIAEALRGGGTAGDVERQAFAFTRQLMTDHFDGLARASDAELHDIARQYAAVANALRRTSTALCAQWFMTGFTPGVRPAPEVMSLLVRVSVMQVAASRSGEAQAREPRPSPTAEDSWRLMAAVAQRSSAVAGLFADPAALAAAPPERKCEAAVALYEAIAGLPPEHAALMTVHLLRQSFLANAPAG